MDFSITRCRAYIFLILCAHLCEPRCEVAYFDPERDGFEFNGIDPGLTRGQFGVDGAQCFAQAAPSREAQTRQAASCATVRALAKFTVSSGKWECRSPLKRSAIQRPEPSSATIVT